MTTTEKNISKELDRSKPPKVGKLKDVEFPKHYETQTDNGITILVVQDKRVPLITSRLVFKRGAFSDASLGEKKSGLASMTAELLTKGTSSRSASEIAEEIDFHGAILSTGCDYDASYITSYSLKKHFNKIFQVTSDVILNSTFIEEEIARLKQQRINSLLSYLDEGDYLASKTFDRIVYSSTAYSNPIEGTKSSINNLTRDDFLNFYKKCYVPNNLIIAFVGDIEIEEAKEYVDQNFRNYQSNSGKEIEEDKLIDIPLGEGTKVYLIEKEGAVQSDIHLGHKGINRSNPDFLPTIVMNTLLGGSFTSRINKNLREVHGYTYGARSNFNWRKFTGDFSVETDVKNKITLKAVKEIINELRKIKDEKISEEELNHTQSYITGSFPLQLETPNAIATKVINLKLYDIKSDYYDTFVSNVNALSIDDILFVAEKYLHPDNLTIAIAGNSKEIKDEMKQLGNVEVIEKVE